MVNLEELCGVVEGILFIAGEGVETDTLMNKLNIKKSEFIEVLEKLKNKYDSTSGINLIEYKNKIQFSSNPSFAEKIEEVLNPIKEKLLSRATLETLSIIAYKQPITRLEIEEIRGVNSDYAIDLLSKNSLIEVVGKKDAIGRPLLYATTEEFLKRFEIKNLSNLPSYDDLLNKIKTIKSSNQGTLYNEFEIENSEEKNG